MTIFRTIDQLAVSFGPAGPKLLIRQRTCDVGVHSDSLKRKETEKSRNRFREKKGGGKEEEKHNTRRGKTSGPRKPGTD